MTTSTPLTTPKVKKANKFTLFCIVSVMAMIVFLAVFWTLKLTEEPAVSAISRDGVVTEIQKMARLNTVAFGVDTVITAQKEGNWYKLWQDEQKGLFVARGRVLAGVDLGKITADNVQVTFDPQTDPKVAPHANITVTLPPSQVFEVFLDDMQVYDWKTGLFGVVDNDPEILNQAQISAKAEVLKKACQGNIMTLATDNATEQIKGLFALTGATVVVNGDVGACRV
ncbi:DUF4230 domain-containing protein [Moraxella bovis]|uniref:DUF4230 domain-containing protein n=1 Tax=Moraxella bovis TaxID=476 RepID=UPI002225BECE|nr:DUF4230 domain-containing protein [Moraxella bovis]UYZ67984.1 DUF4230 domain-containing protein [Moraxella bovis]UYZ70359.1 DUF4230 domain-containing protein [Moraxella bovis]UYZ73731.1 DUF4230 domain-containing protein [Moraxella bovis]UYZ94766.1 DUF4230 domain-containing protein [Moraxella bovis]UZA13658.1 DUF4230 domain-containing protein [Moraxella bovis]